MDDEIELTISNVKARIAQVKIRTNQRLLEARQEKVPPRKSKRQAFGNAGDAEQADGRAVMPRNDARERLRTARDAKDSAS